LPDQQIASPLYTFVDVRAPRIAPEPARATTFEVSATAAVPPALLEAARAEAAAAGFASGWAQGRREATASMELEVQDSARRIQELDEQRRATVQSAFSALERAATTLVANSMETAEEIEDAVLNLAVELAEALLEHEIRLSGTSARDALARALHYVPANAAVTVRLSVADHATLVECAPGDEVQLVTLIADPDLAPGDAIAQCGVTRVDARLGEGLRRVKEILSR
jgi:flagellar assembly protein FliH